MAPRSLTLSKSDKTLLSLLSIAALATTFLFFIDEGYYNFKWMLNPFHWIIFAIYTACLFGGLLLTRWLLFRTVRGIRQLLFTALVGLPVGLAFALILFS